MTINSERRGKITVIAVLFFFLAFFLASCHGIPPKITIEGASAQLSHAIYGEAMVTMTIRNDGGADVLKGVSVDIPGAKAFFHVMEGKFMTPAHTVVIKGGGTVVFKMGGSHIMIEDMPRTMVEGAPFTLTLVFEKAGQKQLHLELEKTPAMSM
jgi:copper(I)-binding protein